MKTRQTFIPFKWHGMAVCPKGPPDHSPKTWACSSARLQAHCTKEYSNIGFMQEIQ